jgi:cell division septation protein DedD
MADEGFHEIQLNGKQLVFLFMAATVVSVVVFLLGVMVGRNVRQPAVEMAAASADSAVDPTAPTESGGAAGTNERIPLSAQETLTYAERLEAPEPAQETPRAQPVAAKPKVPEPIPAVAPAADRAPAPAPAAVETTSFREPPGNGYVVQVMAAVKREEAESLARRLAAKGYPTFVSVGDVKVPAKYRVRVGKYSDKREAEAVESRLKNQEQFKTWLTR